MFIYLLGPTRQTEAAVTETTLCIDISKLRCPCDISRSSYHRGWGHLRENIYNMPQSAPERKFSGVRDCASLRATGTCIPYTRESNSICYWHPVVALLSHCFLSGTSTARCYTHIQPSFLWEFHVLPAGLVADLER